MIIVVMGVSGAGKSRVGDALARSLGWPFIEGDDFHSPANVAKMRSGVPLTDADREPWLHALQARLASLDNAVVACSALTAHFRRSLARAVPDIRFAYLRIDERTAEQRVRTRGQHFMPPELVPSQFATLEEPQDAIEIDARLPVGEIVREIEEGLG